MAKVGTGYKFNNNFPLLFNQYWINVLLKSVAPLIFTFFPSVLQIHHALKPSDPVLAV